MSSDALHERGKVLEEIFFEKREQELIAAMKAKAAHEHQVEELADHTGISDQSLIERITELGITMETLAAFSIVPLLAVAWSDEVLDTNERDAILLEAVDAGISRKSAGYQLLQSWLTRAPNQKLVDAWKAYHTALAPHLDAHQKASLKSTILARAQHVARASGGVLGIGSTSKAERDVMAELEALLSA